MTVLAILQNMWFRDPGRVRLLLERNPAARDRVIRYALFAGCLTGRRLKQVFGQDWCDEIHWEEASPQIGAHASSVFPADPFHIRAAIDRLAPSVVLAFGKVAEGGCRSALANLRPGLIIGPHPAARGPDTMLGLMKMRTELDRMGLKP